MRGIDIARGYYETYGRPMLEEQFPAELPRIAVGIVGEGSECLGYDDELSRDHDFEPGFCLWLTRADAARFGFALERAYARLPKEYAGAKRQMMAPVGGPRHGVLVMEDFYTRFLGDISVPETPEGWFRLPSHQLLAASNGEVWRDDLGIFSRVRAEIQAGYPEDVRRKKLAAHLVFMAQTGQYNYVRLIARGETGAAGLAMSAFLRHTISCVYLLNHAYEPYYKWSFRGMRDLPNLSEMAELLTNLGEMGNSPKEAEIKKDVVEDIARMVSRAVCEDCRVEDHGGDLERLAYEVNGTVRDPYVRGLHIMAGAEF